MNRTDSTVSKAEPPGQFKIAQALQFEHQMKRISQEIEKLMQIVSQHGLKIKELSTVAANSVSQVEFMSAITTTRFQALNVVKSMKTENQQKQSETAPLSSLNDNSNNEESHELKHLKHSLQQLENEQFNQNFKNNMENKRLENEVKSARKEMNDMRNYILQLEQKLELFVDAVEDAGINTNVSFVGNQESSIDDVSPDQRPPTAGVSDNNQPVQQEALRLPEGVMEQVVQKEADVVRMMDDSISDVGSPLGSPVPTNTNTSSDRQRDRKQSAGDLMSRPRKMSNSSQRQVINKSPDTLPNPTTDDNPNNNPSNPSSPPRPSRFSSSAVTSSELRRLEADVTQRIDDAIQRVTTDVIAVCQVDTGAIVREVVRRQADVSAVKSLAETVTSEAMASLLGGFSAISEKALAQHRKALPAPTTSTPSKEGRKRMKEREEGEEGGGDDDDVSEEVQGEGDVSELEENNVRATKTRQSKKSRKSVRTSRQSIIQGKGKEKGSVEAEKGSGRKMPRHVTFQRPSSEATPKQENENSEEEEEENEGEGDREEESNNDVIVVKKDVTPDSRPSSRQAMAGKQPPSRQATPPRRVIEEVQELDEQEDDRMTSVTGFKLPEHLQPRPLVPMRDAYDDVASDEVLGQDLALPDDLLSVLENAEFTERLSLLEPLELEDLSSLVSSIVEVNFDHLHLPQTKIVPHVLSLVDEGVGEDVVEEDSRQRTTPVSSPRASSKGSKPNTPRKRASADPPMPFVGEQGMDNEDDASDDAPPVQQKEEEAVIEEVRQVVMTRQSKSKVDDVLIITDELSEHGTPRAQTAAENVRRETVTNTLRASNTPAPPSPTTTMANTHALSAAFAAAFPSPPSPTPASPTTVISNTTKHYELVIDIQPVVTSDEPFRHLSPKPASPRSSKPNSPRNLQPAPTPAPTPTHTSAHTTTTATGTDTVNDSSNPYPMNSRFEGPVPSRLHLPTTADVDSIRRPDIRNTLAQRGWLTKEEWEKELMTSFETQIIMKVYDIIQRKLQRLCNEINDRFSIIDRHTITLIEQGNYVITKVEKLVQHQQTVQRVQRHLLSTTHYLQHQSAEVQTINKDLVDPLHALLSVQREEVAQFESLVHGLRQRVESLERDKVTSGSGRATMLRQQQQQHQQNQTLVLPSLALLSSNHAAEATKVAEEVARADSFLYEAKAESLLFGLDFLSKEMRRLQATYHDITTQQEVLTKKVEKVVAEQAKPAPRVIKPFSPTRQASASGERERVASSLNESTHLSKEVLAKALTEVNVLDLPSFQPLVSDVTHMKKVVQMCYHLLDAQQRSASSQGKSRPSPRLSNMKEFHFLFDEDAENEEVGEGLAPPQHRPTSSLGFSKKGRNLKEAKEVVTSDVLPTSAAPSSSKVTSEQKRLLLPKATPTNTPSQPNKDVQTALLTQTMQYLDFVRKVDRETEVKFSPTPPIRPRPPPYLTKPTSANTPSNTPSIPLQLSDSFSSHSDWVMTPND